MSDQTAELTLKIDAPDLDANELDALTNQLRNEIKGLDVESVERVKRGSIPEGAMGADWVQIGELAIKLAPYVIPALVTVLNAWIDRKHKGSTEKKLKIRLKVKNVVVEIDNSLSRQEQTNIVSKLQQETENNK